MGIVGRKSLGITLLIALVALPVRSATTAQEPSLDQVLARAGHYVTRLHEQLSGIVAEETYAQEVRAAASRMSGPSALPRKRLKSDLLLVKSPHSNRYAEFRDVFEVNGTPVRDRQERLTRLFLTPAPGDADLLKAIVDESARHNIGAIPRNINTPMLALSFLQPDTQRRFRFSRERNRPPRLGNVPEAREPNGSIFRITTEMWAVAFRETGRPTIIRTSAGRDFPAAGRLWIDPVTGAVLMSELTMNNGEVSATINVSYQSEPMLGFLVPVEMRERYQARGGWVEGIASYGRFRQFQVKTVEVIGRPPGGLE